MPPDPGLRAGDDDRERVVSRLADHLAAGRLDTAEFEERMTAAYAARTFGELAPLLSDLPRTGSPAAPAPASPPRESAPRAFAVPYERLRPYAAWLLTGVVCLTVWAGTSLAAGTLLAFWPFWVIVPWGAVLLLGARRSSPLCCGPSVRRRS